ncbi:carboxymuconolactone decarboxylase family protein [Mycolicibacterium sp. P1-18]|uniref:carboxymuconolactone decarboxylase family protein n=1 Tax=Mycolicibacterium sp. P1-18 TaxID=2024615 RepID=UPI0011F13CD3|nr:carboxymuconolactone decarboxylase family protein [Mycolicibacterium sp. P1-18]KAA0098836.1 carboxymuconolactone decarboxylase family protein [Mycolicibacterium sp. P1-18]
MDTQHVHIDKQTPDAYRAMVAVATAVTKSAREVGLSRSLTELVNVRVSQINGCPSCLEVHHARAVAAGVTDKQLATLSVWRDTELFDDREQAALRLAEITTTLPDHDTAEREYARAREVLTDDELSAVIWVATAINAFNRVSILSRHPVRP